MCHFRGGRALRSFQQINQASHQRAGAHSSLRFWLSKESCPQIMGEGCFLRGLGCYLLFLTTAVHGKPNCKFQCAPMLILNCLTVLWYFMIYICLFLYFCTYLYKCTKLFGNALTRLPAWVPKIGASNNKKRNPKKEEEKAHRFRRHHWVQFSLIWEFNLSRSR